jgi:DmpG-like communication domain
MRDEPDMTESYGANCVYCTDSAGYMLPTADILVEVGNRKAVGGQEDLIEEVAMDLAARRVFASAA